MAVKPLWVYQVHVRMSSRQCARRNAKTLQDPLLEQRAALPICKRIPLAECELLLALGCGYLVAFSIEIVVAIADATPPCL